MESDFFKFFSKKAVVFSLLGALMAIVYVPFMIHGGISMEGWVGVDAASGTTWADNFWVVLRHVPNRPVLVAIAFLTGRLFGENPVGYNVLSILFWLMNCALAASVLKRFLGGTAAMLFVLFASVPVAASSALLHSSVLLGMIAAVLFWTVSFHYLVKFQEGKKWLDFALGYFFVLMSLLTYEVTLPLIVLNILLPFVYRDKKVVLKIVGHGLMVASLVGLSSLNQLILMPRLLHIHISSLILNGMTLRRVVWSVGSWFYSLSFDLPILLLSSLNKVGILEFSEVALLLFLLIFGIKQMSNQLETRSGMRKLFLMTVLISLMSCAALFIFSIAKPSTYGYANRVLLSSYFLLCIFLADATSHLSKSRAYWVCALVLLPFYTSMISQRDNFIEAARLAKAILEDCAHKVLEQNVPAPAAVFANVPEHTAKNINNEEVLLGWWDFGFGLKYFTKGVVDPVKSHVITVNYLVKKADEGYENHFTSRAAEVRKNLWYYEYDIKSGQSFLRRIPEDQDIHVLIDEIKAKNLNGIVPILSLEIKERVKSRFKLGRDLLRKG